MQFISDLKCQSKSYMKCFIVMPQVLRLFHLNMNFNMSGCASVAVCFFT
jgi:hypothetical protein